MILPPVRLNQDTINQVDIDISSLRSEPFKKTRHAEVPRPPQDALGRTHNQINRLLGERVVPESCPIELGENESMRVVGIHTTHDVRVCDSASYVLVDRKSYVVHQRRLSDENDVVVLRKIFEQQSQLSECLHLKKVCIVDNDNETLALTVEAECLLNETSFTLESGTGEFDIECLAEYLDCVGICVESSGDGDNHHSLVVGLTLQRILYHGLSRSGHAQ